MSIRCNPMEERRTVIDSLMARLSPRIEQHADFWVELLAYRIEQPSMRVDLFRILLLEHEYDLHRDLEHDELRASNRAMTHQIVRVARMRLNELWGRIHRELRRILLIISTIRGCLS